MVRDGAKAPRHHEAVQRYEALILRGRETIDAVILRCALFLARVVLAAILRDAAKTPLLQR
jgi:hypothetical protein